jgi:hypothetical protein
MKTYQAGDSGDLAEVIIDFKKKKVKLINPQKKGGFKKSRFGPNINGLILISAALLCFILSFILKLIIGHTDNLWYYAFIGLLFINYLIGLIFYPEYNNWIDKWNQKIFNGYLGTKKVVIVKNIKERTWKLPYEFKNVQLDYKLYGDYKKVITKIHIKPKEYYIKSFGKLVKQIEEWEAFFYFSRVPKKGKMIIEFS